MRGAWSALLTVLATTAAARIEPEAREALHALKRRIVAELGMRKLPDLRYANVSAEHVQRVTRQYFQALRRTEQEIVHYHPKGNESAEYLLFDLDFNALSNLQWARLRFPDSSFLDTTALVRLWQQGPRGDLVIPCTGLHCSTAKLELLVHKARTKRSTCSKQCCRRSLKISFKEIGWDWIIQPVEFEAFYCKGRCRNMSDDYASTHALMQSILNYKGHQVSRPCCAPRRLRPLNLLHYNDKDPPELVVTRQKGMIVKECACL